MGKIGKQVGAFVGGGLLPGLFAGRERHSHHEEVASTPPQAQPQQQPAPAPAAPQRDYEAERVAHESSLKAVSDKYNAEIKSQTERANAGIQRQQRARRAGGIFAQRDVVNQQGPISQSLG